ncbi:hypothetical protein E1A91_D10G157900v1 [Gossypium mustelinum]|uniref:Uncharacterized protein n=2 Tax=Gossypium TaxID=3633 RepID=A0A5D2T942_GOSMU|nr:hypothetical protein ES332_D10G167200v1 [Gossypium tomentosum]TYH49888.1 hypothetical protein ES332_D10G167200v1 [Gossypium tomentosum]TYI61215.1 hypothetical protein E1A91_D10G157900v1 [Gossypium mustelinum]TYI61216.1 hypothetical protein E1A91_D10G157900v1 [Gossypium mustelinum]
MKATCCRQLHIYRKEDLLSWYHHYYLAKPKITLLMPPDLKKQELAKRYSKRADATEDLQ